MISKGEQLVIQIKDPDIRAAIKLHEDSIATAMQALNDLAAAVDYQLSVLLNRLDAVEAKARSLEERIRFKT